MGLREDEAIPLVPRRRVFARVQDASKEDRADLGKRERTADVEGGALIAVGDLDNATAHLEGPSLKTAAKRPALITRPINARLTWRLEVAGCELILQGLSHDRRPGT